MDSLNQRTISPKILLIAGGILVLFIVLFSLLTLSNKTKKNSPAAGNENQQANALPSGPVPTFSPPENFLYSTVDSVNFLPTEINGYSINATKLRSTARRLYPNTEVAALDDIINETIFNWLALNQFYQSNNPSKVSALFNTKKIDNYTTLIADNQKLLKDYQPNVIKIDGYYLKLRFVGTLKSNLVKLKKSQADLQPLARQLIENYRTQIAQNKGDVLESFNKNNTILLMNNREASKRFTNAQIFPPLVAHTDYYQMIESLPVGISNVITLRSKVSSNVEDQEYAYVVFNISKKTGTYIPVQALANEYVAKAQIK